uniref:Putative RNA-binding protein EIF1AD n=1 Tax=Rhizophora mucronata TaxID=61149 RepID=A0A2P2R070_RHIMU
MYPDVSVSAFLNMVESETTIDQCCVDLRCFCGAPMALKNLNQSKRFFSSVLLVLLEGPKTHT